MVAVRCEPLSLMPVAENAAAVPVRTASLGVLPRRVDRPASGDAGHTSPPTSDGGRRHVPSTAAAAGLLEPEGQAPTEGLVRGDLAEEVVGPRAQAGGQLPSAEA